MHHPSEHDINVAVDYLQNRLHTVNGIDMPEEFEDFMKRTGQTVSTEDKYLLDCALVKLYPSLFADGYLEGKYAR